MHGFSEGYALKKVNLIKLKKWVFTIKQYVRVQGRMDPEKYRTRGAGDYGGKVGLLVSKSYAYTKVLSLEYFEM